MAVLVDGGGRCSQSHLQHKIVLLWHVYCIVVYCVLCTHSIQFQRSAKIYSVINNPIVFASYSLGL
jgi:hypothetical protein